MHITSLEAIFVRKDCIRLGRVRHVFLNAKVMNCDTEVQRCRHRHRREIGSAVTAGSHMIERRKVSRLLQMGQAPAMHNGHAYVIDPLVPDQIVSIPVSC